MNCQETVTPIAISTQISKDEEGSNVDPNLYKRLVESLMYLTSTRPDIMFVVSWISRFMECLKRSHWKYTKIILRYVTGTTNYGILYT